MKKLLRYIPLLALAVIVSCTITEEGLDKAAVINVSVDKMEIDAIGGKETITITSYCDWTQKVSYKNGSTGWVKLSSKGVSGTNHVTVTFDENKRTYDRNATFIISNDRYDLSQSIEIHQKAAEPFILLDKSEIEVTGDGETIGLIVNSNIDYTIASSEPWARTSSVSGIKGENKISITVDNSPVTEPRSATITFSGKEHDTTATFSITQKELVPTIEVNTESINIVAAGETKSVTLESNISWEASCDADWVTVTPTNGENGTSTLKVKVAENTNTAARESVVKIFNTEYNIEKQIQIYQSALNPTLNVSTESISAPAAGTTKNLTLDRNISWEASCDAEWVTITPTKGDEGTSTIKIEVAANTKTIARESVVKIFNTEYNIEKQIQIYQSAFNPTLNVSTESISAPAAGTTKNLTIQGNISWEASCDADWVTITPTNGGQGTLTFRVNVASNTNTTARNTIVKVFNSEYNIEKQIAISQEGFIISIKTDITPWIYDIPACGATYSFNLESNVSWIASCSANWATVSRTNGNAGSYNITITVDCVDTFDESRYCEIYISSNDGSVRKTISLYQLAGYGGWGIVGAHQDNPWDITSPIPMSHYPGKDGMYILRNVKLVSDGFKFAKFGLNNWNDPTTYFGAWGETAGYSYFDYGYMVGFDWYYLESGIDSQQQSNIGVSDWSKRYDILLYIPYDDDGASYAQFAVLETGSYSFN